LLHVGHGRAVGVRVLGPFVIGAARQSRKTLLLEDNANIGRAERVSLLLKQAANVINREVLLAGLDDAVANRIGFGSMLGAFGWGQEKGPGGVLTEMVDQDAETALGVAKAAGRLFGGELVDEEGAQSLVLAVGGVGGLKEGLRRVS
jgi:hypothetical protein